MSYTIVQELANSNTDFWSGEKVEQISETSKVEAWLNFDKNTAVLTRVHTLNDNSLPASVFSDILYGSFSTEKGIFKGGTVVKAAQVEAEPSMAYKDQNWKIFEINSPFEVNQSIEPFISNNSYDKSNQFYNLTQRKPNPIHNTTEQYWQTKYVDRRLSETATYPNRYDDWEDAKNKLIEWGFEHPFLDEYYGYTENFKELDIYDNIQYTKSSGVNPSQAAATINAPTKFKVKNIDKITNFNPSTDTLEIDTDSFGIDSSATFAAGKNKKVVKKKLAKQDFDFLYDEKKGGLYFNENGAEKGFGEGGIIAILKGAPDLTSGNLKFI